MARPLLGALLALLLGTMFATSNKGHRYERSKDACDIDVDHQDLRPLEAQCW